MEINEIIKKILFKRGIVDEAQVQEFLSQSPKMTYDPLLLPDMEAGADLILSEVNAGSNIMIYGDYDADGITSTALMISIMKHLVRNRDAGKLDFYIPSRFEEGYGLNRDAIQSIYERGFNFIITVDCGSVSKEEVEFAGSLGIKVLVTDHHTITDRMAGCLLINPKRPGSKYPFTELSGCGVAFKLAQVLQVKAGLPKSVLTEVLDLVAIGTVGDIMPLVDENRTLVKFGLKVIKSGNRPGLRKLIEGAGLHPGSISSEDVGYVIVPHLNASGRIEDASQAVRLMLAHENDSGIQRLVEDILEKNKERKRLQAETYEKCNRLVRPEDFILIRCDDAHEGIAGIVAGKIKEEYYRPAAIVMPTNGEKMLKGTGRSIEGVSLYDLLKKHEDLFVKFGGHAGACGFTIDEDNLASLREGLKEDMRELRQQNPELFVKKYHVDSNIDASDINMEFCNQLELLAPFGNRNPKPSFRLNHVKVKDVRYMGSDSQHVRFYALGEGGKSIQCVLFNRASGFAGMLEGKAPINIIGSCEVQEWQGNRRIQFIVENIID